MEAELEKALIEVARDDEERRSRLDSVKFDVKYVYICPTCDLSFMNATAWKRHRIDSHGYQEDDKIKEELLKATRPADKMISLTVAEGVIQDVEPDNSPAPVKKTVRKRTTKTTAVKNVAVSKRGRSHSKIRASSEQAVPLRKPTQPSPVFSGKLGSSVVEVVNSLRTEGSSQTTLKASMTTVSNREQSTLEGECVSRNQLLITWLPVQPIGTMDLVNAVREMPATNSFDLVNSITSGLRMSPTEREVVRLRISAIQAARKEVADRLSRMLVGGLDQQLKSDLIELIGKLSSPPPPRAFE